MKKVLIFLYILSIISNLHNYGSNPDYKEWWFYNHGDYTNTRGKNDPWVKWAHEVFERVKNVADKAEARQPRLFIINTRRDIYAQALPDGCIIINPKTLEICYKDAGRKKGDQRIAFILGHELAHLANDDFMHREVFMALEKYGKKKAQQELTKYFKLPENKTKEFMADKKGSFYAAMAGFDINELFGKKNNFLQHWAKQTGVGMSYDDLKHPTLAKRLQFIRLQQKAVVNQLELFKAGVLLYQVENYLDGAAAFREFAKIYPAREVLNNIGACYFNLALRYLQLKFSKDYYRFRLSTTIDYETTAVKMHSRGEVDYLQNRKIARYLTKSIDYFKQAAARDSFDRASRYNLSAALIFKKQYAEALTICKHLLEKYPGDIGAINNKAVAFYFYGKEEDLETTQKAIQLLQKAHETDPENLEVLYNLASLKQERERLAGARLYWEKYLKLPIVPGDNFYKLIYKRLKGKAPLPPACKSPLPEMPSGIGLRETFSNIEKRWKDENTRAYKLGNEESSSSDNWYLDLQVIVRDNVRVIALDGTVELIEKEFPGVTGAAEIIKKFGPPQRILRHTGGHFYLYKDRGFSFKEVHGKVCSYTWFEKKF